MAAVSKAKFGRSLKARLDALSCPYSEGTEEDWIVELVFKPGEPRIRLLQWIFSKYDSALGEMVDNPQSAILGSKMDSRMQRLLFVASNLGLCRYDDVDLIRGVESSATSIFNKQVKFMDRLLDIVTIQDTAEDPMTKSLLHAGVISDASPLEEQVVADCRLMDALVSKQLPNTMLTHSVDLIPHDIRRLMQQHDSKEGLGDVPTLYKLTDMCSNIERNLTRRMEILEEMQDVKSEDSSRLHRASHSLDLVLGDLSQLVVSFTYTYENEMLPWCHRAPLHFSQLGPAFRRVHALITKFAQWRSGRQQSPVSRTAWTSWRTLCSTSSPPCPLPPTCAPLRCDCDVTSEEDIEEQASSMHCCCRGIPHIVDTSRTCGKERWKGAGCFRPVWQSAHMGRHSHAGQQQCRWFPVDVPADIVE